VGMALTISMTKSKSISMAMTISMEMLGDDINDRGKLVYFEKVGEGFEWILMAISDKNAIRNQKHYK
jgi:hypothetical protein